MSGYCPMGCGQTLFLGDGGHVTCSFVGCPEPGAVSRILAQSETEHTVTFDSSSFSMMHPLRERLGDLASCPLHVWLNHLFGPPVKPGVYRAVHDKTLERWHFAEVIRRADVDELNRAIDE